VKYSVENKDIPFILSIKKFQALTACLNSSITTKKVYSNKWTIPFASIMNMRLGKSLFDTKFIYAINQHGASATDNSNCINVPIQFGYVSHFRHDVKEFFANQSYPFNFFQFDLEHFFFLYSLKRN